jgi:monovalent cation:H+ antiporter-2, CPA2 family
MLHETPLIATLVAGLGLAFVFGAVAQWLRIPPLVGYLLAGMAIGPFTPGFVADQALATELAELGIILLMFGIGLHLSLHDLLSVRAIALGLALSVASTVILLGAMQERRLMETDRGRIAVGWLIVEDLAMVLGLVLLPALASLLGASSGMRTPIGFPLSLT